MIEEGLYDSEPPYVRATIYEKIFEKPPFSGFESHDALIDREKLYHWMKENGFELFHCKLMEYHSDGEERSARYYVNKTKKTMIMLRRSYTDPTKKVNVMSSDDSPLERNAQKNPNKLVYFCFFADSEQQILEFKKTFDSLKIKEDTKNRLYMLKATEYGGLELDSFPTECGNTSLDLNYGSKFQNVHTHILDCLNNKKSGLYIFHGPAGTGKTSYIKYLTTIMDTRKVIFVPSTMVAELFSPKMVDKLYSFKNAILVLEDAEICVFKRDGKNNELVSGILNITDGLLKDLLNISIIVTFNSADTNELDTALLRKGRLKIMHKFDLLSKEDAKTLAKYLGKKNPIVDATSLADVYNLDEDTGIEAETGFEKKFGFSQM